MTSGNRDQLFAGAIPELYESYLVPMIFEPYAEDLAARVASRTLTRVLEVAAGTGVVTRRLAAALPPSAAIVATDLNPAMLDQAALVATSRAVEWRQADALQQDRKERHQERNDHFRQQAKAKPGQQQPSGRYNDAQPKQDIS